MEIRKFDKFNNYLEFLDKLKSFNIPLEKYGNKGFKTVGHLYSEIEEGETELTEEGGSLIRRVSFVGARVLYKKDGEWLRLFEEKQVFKDGRTRVRKEMPFSAAEKFKKGEDPKEVIIRGIDEELGIKINSSQFTFYNKMTFENNDDYPGIISYHT
jgi:hypothetical protein